MNPIKIVRALSLGVLSGLVVGWSGALPAAADPVADFYKGRTITIMIGSGFGGSYGLYSQLAARHIGRHIPGNPTIIVQSMPGAAGLKEIAYTYNAAPKDGSVIDLTHQEVLQESILNEKARFDVRKFNWLGRFVDVDYIAVVTARSGIKSIDDARKKQIVAGATGARGASAIGPELFNRIAGTKFKVVAGYKGTDEMFLAQEKGEVDMVTATWVIVRAAHAEAFNSGKLIPICAMALERIPDLPKVPTITEFGSDPAAKTFVRIWAAGGTVGRSLATPPGVPADRVKALRTAFDQMLQDPAFKEDVAKHKTPFNPMSGTKLAARIEQVATLSPQEIASARKLYAELLSTKGGKGKGKGK